MLQPEVGGERVVRNSSHDAVLERVAGLQAEDAHGFDAHVLIRREVYDGGIRVIGDRTRQNVRCAAARMNDMHHGDFHRFKRAVEIKVELRELANAEFAMNLHQRMNLFAAVTVRLETYFGFKQFNLRGMSSLLR